mgnify:FL=1
MADTIQIIEEKLKSFENKYTALKGKADNNVLSEIENALKGIKTSLQEAKSQSSSEAEITIGSLNEAVQEIEDYLNTL